MTFKQEINDIRHTIIRNPEINTSKIKFPNIEGAVFEVYWTLPKKGSQKYETTSSTRAFRKWDREFGDIVPYYEGNEIMLKDPCNPYSNEKALNYLRFLEEIDTFIKRQKS